MTKMASGAVTMTWEDIHVLDRVGPSYRPIEKMSAERKARILLLVYIEEGFELGVWVNAMLVHEDGGRTYIRGQCEELGLDGDINSGDVERECEELRGRRLTQALISVGKAVYVLTDDGVLFSCGDPKNGQLGRRDPNVPFNKFGRVVIDDPVLAIATALNHVLAMTATKVFAFGANDCHEAGASELSQVPEPLEIYSGKGPKAPKQVACGCSHSVILTVEGQVLTCGCGEYNGHGLKDGDIPRMTAVPKLHGVTVQQIGCTYPWTVALADGVLYFWGQGFIEYNEDAYLEPTVVHWKHRICSFRCSQCLVLALTDTGEALHWGWLWDGTATSTPRRVERFSIPREVFSRGRHPDSGGTVYMDTTENRKRVFPVVTCPHKLVAELGVTKTKIAELHNALENANRREADAREACDQAKSKLLEAEARISLLETSSENAKRREIVAREDCKSAQSRLLEAEARISAAELASEESRRRETAADQTKRLLEQEIRELQSRIACQQMELDFLKEHARQREITKNDIQDIRSSIEATESSIRNVIQDALGASESRLGDSKHRIQVDKEAMAAQISNMKHEISALQMEKRELKINNRELTLDYRELNTEYQKLINETSEATTSVKRIVTPLQEEWGAEGTSYSPSHHSRYPREAPDAAHGARGRRSGKRRSQFGKCQQRPKDPDGKDK